MLDISVIIPVYNEEKNVLVLYRELKSVLDGLKRSYEIIMVDDGSRKDNSWLVMAELAAKDVNLKVIQQARNYGMTATLQNGIDHSLGNYIITLSSDLEVETREVSNVVKKLDEGWDVVNTNRVGRWKDKKLTSLLRSIPSGMANALISKVSGVKIKDQGSGLKGFKKFILDNLKYYGEMQRFMVAYCPVYTDKICEFDVRYKPRVYGTPAYGSLKRTFAVFLDIIPLMFFRSFSTKPYTMMPGRLFGTSGFLMIVSALMSSTYLVVDKLVFKHNIGSRPLLLFSLIFLVIGVELVLTGLLGELMMRIFFESTKRKPYSVRDKINFGRSTTQAN